MTLLQVAEKLGNISKTCRMHKVSRNQFQEYKQDFQEYGLEGLKNRPPPPPFLNMALESTYQPRPGVADALPHPA